MTETIDFKLFLALWNRFQGLSTPAIHFRMAGWLEDAWKAGRKKLLLMAFRGAGKSTIAGLFASWLLWRNPDLRILVLAADYTLAKKMVRTVKRIIERHPLTGHLKPDNADQWAGDRFTVKRTIVRRDPSMIAHGITSNITGSHADVVICDDVEVPKTCDSAEKRRALRERLMEIDYVLEGGTQIYLGTPHSYYTIYADTARMETGEDVPFLDGFERLSIPVVDDDEECAWPERFGAEEIEDIKRRTGPNKFASQMLLRPVNIAEGRLDPEQLQFYDGKIAYLKELNRLEINNKRMVSASAWWDPAFGTFGGDDSVFAAVFTCEDGEYWLQKVKYIEVDPYSGDDEAAQQCRAVAFEAQLLRLPFVAVETNGIGKFLPTILRNAIGKNNVGCAVKEMASTPPKDLRILEAFDAVLAARALHVHESVKDTPFLMEMAEWRPGLKNANDDGLDAVAGALSLEPVRLERVYTKAHQSWTGSGKTQKAKTDFDV